MRPVLISCVNRNDSAAMARDADIHAIHAKGPESENQAAMPVPRPTGIHKGILRSEEHTSELQSLMRISSAVFCLNKKTHTYLQNLTIHTCTHDNSIKFILSI